MNITLQVILALVIANLYEWVFHNYILHRLGKRKNNIFQFHWTHHRKVRKSGGYDPDYEKLFPPSKEVCALFFLFALHLPFFWVFPYFVVTLAIHGLAYYFLHRHSHMDPAWGKRWLPWHYDHHFGKDQDSNWCVLFPLWDYILNTRNKARFSEWHDNAWKKNNRSDV